MADIDISQSEADELIAMEKIRADNKERLFSAPGVRLAIPLTSTDERENFMLDVTRSQIRLTKATLQNRARQAIVLLRLDLDGPMHRNPDGQEIPCPHLHVYREGYGDKWAVPAPAGLTSESDLFAIFESFMRYCNITEPPLVKKGLFS